MTEVQTWLRAQGQPMLTDAQLVKLSLFQSRLLDVNRRMNLTAITRPADIAVKHFIDSLTLLPWLRDGMRVIDLGAGAGFPGLVLKIAMPMLHMSLLDSMRKRVRFLEETTGLLELSGIVCLHARAEEAARKPEHAAQYDCVTARAVARLDKLVKFGLPFVKPSGMLLAMKGPDTADELREAERMTAKRGGVVKEVRAVKIAPGMTHTIVVIEKR